MRTMRTTPYVIVTCDGCGKLRDINTCAPFSQLAQYTLKTMGWYTNDYVDLCPRCRRDIDAETSNSELNEG